MEEKSCSSFPLTAYFIIITIFFL
uniref:Uncharacterized protein n=1 Tax=Rhizophora mucronata TaxID=61149 RepID=A0A2P2JDV4_RHIMU